MPLREQDGGPAMDEFHAHLDQCFRCRECPLSLCPYGALLLKRAAVETPVVAGRVAARERT